MKRLLRLGVTFAVVGVSILAVVPASGSSAPAVRPSESALVGAAESDAAHTPGATARRTTAAASFRFENFTVTNGMIVRTYVGNIYLGYVRLLVYPNRRKHITVCDMRPDAVGLSPGLEIDPTGAGPPDTLRYTDPTGNEWNCLERNIGYPVRKWRAVIHGNGTSYAWDKWRIDPLPRPDY